MRRNITSDLKRGLLFLCAISMSGVLVSGCANKKEEGNPFLLNILLNCLGSCGDTAVNNEFSNPVKVTISGYSGDAMEPFITRNTVGTIYLFFNSLNDGQDTSLHYASRDTDTTFTYIGEINGVNGDPPHLDAVASMDTSNHFYFISVRGWPADYRNLFTGSFSGGSVTSLHRLDGDFYIESPGWIVMDGEVSPDGSKFYFVNAHFSGGSVPDRSDIGIATGSSSAFFKDADSASIMANINTSRCLEYAPSISDSGLELFFTRLQLCPIKAEILMARRSSTSDPFGAPERISAISGFVEAPSLTFDGKTLYYHMKDNGVYTIYKVSRP
jgi:Tol biopolymer transport system component